MEQINGTELFIILNVVTIFVHGGIESTKVLKNTYFLKFSKVIFYIIKGRSS
jgi:hypothetical protein